MFLLFDTENHIDPIVCRSETEVHNMVLELGDAPFQVLRIDVDEYCRDVTDQFIVEVEEAPEYPDFTAADRRELMVRSGAFGR